MQETSETRVPSLSQKDLLDEEMAIHSRILPGESHEHRSLAGYSPRGCKESRHDRATKHSTAHVRAQLRKPVLSWTLHCLRLSTPNYQQLKQRQCFTEKRLQSAFCQAQVPRVLRWRAAWLGVFLPPVERPWELLTRGSATLMKAPVCQAAGLAFPRKIPGRSPQSARRA